VPDFASSHHIVSSSTSLPLRLFNTRSPHRPHPIGLHRVRITRIEAARIQVSALEAVNGTPILDIKPVLAENVQER
jgi:tRNA (Thr-GGU) A37 N-methylase